MTVLKCTTIDAVHNPNGQCWQIHTGITFANDKKRRVLQVDSFAREEIVNSIVV
jgi:hypothetical protein